MSERTPIPSDLAAQVLYASDRSCCVCRVPGHPQIHHIDGDPSNNTFDNLAVVCLHCHSDAHTTGAFVRRLTPEVLRLYNSSWRETVQLRLNPARDPEGQREYAGEVYLEMSLDCHSWKNTYVAIDPEWADRRSTSEPLKHGDIWDALVEACTHVHSEDTWIRFKPLFQEGIPLVSGRLDRIVQLHGTVLPHDFRTLVMRTQRRMTVERNVYLMHPVLRQVGITGCGDDQFFRTRLTETLILLGALAREADKRREEILS